MKKYRIQYSTASELLVFTGQCWLFSYSGAALRWRLYILARRYIRGSKMYPNGHDKLHKLGSCQQEQSSRRSLDLTRLYHRPYEAHLQMDSTDSASKLPAAKLFISLLSQAQKPREAAATLDVCQTGLVLLGLEFTRVWLQVSATLVTPIGSLVPTARVAISLLSSHGYEVQWVDGASRQCASNF